MRWLALKHLQQKRKERQDAHWSYVQSVLVGVGNLMGTWGFIERQIGTLICNHFPHAPEKLRKNGLPSTLEQKIKYLVEIAKDERMPEQLRLEIREWVSELHRLRLHRHLIAHGTLFQRNTFSVRWYVHELTLRGDRPEFPAHSFKDKDLRTKQNDIGQARGQE